MPMQATSKCSCSCRRSTFAPKEFSYKNVQSHSPFVPQFFFVAHFILTTVSYGLPSPFRSPSIDYLLNLSYYSTIVADKTSVFCHITLPGACISSVTLRIFLVTPDCSGSLTSVICFSAIARFSYFCHLLQCDRKAMRCFLNADLLNSKFLMV